VSGAAPRDTAAGAAPQHPASHAARAEFDAPRGHRLEIALLFARVLAEVALTPLHLVAFLLRRRHHRDAFQRALDEAAP